MLPHGHQRVFAETARTAPGFLAVEARKVVGQHGNVAVAVAQWRSDHLQYIQTVIQVFTKRTLCHGGFQVDVSRRQHPHIHRDGLAAADTLDLFFLQESQQVGLQLHRQIADLIKKQRATIGRLDPPDLTLMGASKCALFVAKQFGLDQVFGDRAAVDRDKRLGMALGLAVQGFGHQFFAGAAVAADQDRGLSGRQLGQQLAQLADRSAVAQQLVFGLVHCGITLAPQPCHAKGTAKGDLHSGHIKRQGMEVKKPFADKIPDILQPQHVLGEHRDPLSAAAADQLLDGFGPLQVIRLQTQQTHIAGSITHGRQRTAVHFPSRRT